MGFFRWMDRNVKKLDTVDIQFIKLSVAGFVLFLAKVFPPILGLHWYWYLIISVVAAIRPIYRALR